MIVLMIAGGSGTRLWPLSTPEIPKHLLSLTGEESLLQAAFRRAKLLTEIGKIYVITEAGHAHLVREQLPGLPPEAFIVEPARRGTASCILAGLHHVKARGHDLDEPLAFKPADHFIRDTRGFVQSYKIAEKASRKYNKVVQVGVEPTYPNTGLGYIHKNGTVASDSLVYEVQGFKEKPEYAVAQEYVRSGEYLWNCSYWIGSVNTFAKEMAAHAPELKAKYDHLCAAKTEAAYKKTYLSFDNDAIDYAFAELVPPGTFLVVPAAFDWVDIGNFTDLYDVVEKDKSGNYYQGDGIVALDVENSYIRNDVPHTPVAVIGLDNVVVVRTPQGLLVLRRDLAQKVKEAQAAVYEKSPKGS